MKTPLRVLLVEDNENDAALVIRRLEKSEYAITYLRVEDETEMKQALDDMDWDIVISDFSLPQFDALAALKALQESGIDIPFIVVSGTIGEDTAVEMMRSGAQDYLMKDNMTRLIPAITRELADAKVRLEHKTAAISLRQSEARFRAVFENSVDAIGISLNGVHVFINPAYFSLFGFFNPDELIGTPILDLIAPEEHTRLSSYIQNRSAGDLTVPTEYETIGLRRTGDIFNMEVRVSLFDFNGQFHTLVILRDITARKKEETELMAAKRREEESSLLKSTLMMNMSHEVRTPMNAILGFSSLIMNESNEEDIRQMADRIRVSGDRLMKTLDDILELTQLQTGVESIDLTEFDIEPEVQRVVDKFAGIANRRNLTLEFRSDGPLVSSINADLFEKAIGELINNAIKFTIQGGVTVFLRSHDPGDFPWAEVRIEDTGIGIEKASHEIIFESFRQLSGGYGRSYEGSGLGLTIAKKIIDLLKGEIIVESEPGKGSVFIVKLPGVNPSGKLTVAANRRTKLRDSKDGSLSAGHSGLHRILLVEDNEDNVFVTREFCRDYFTVDEALNGTQAIEMAKGTLYDLVLMDINLGPGINGLEVANKLKKINHYDTVPIIALTGLTFRQDKDRLLAGGCDYYLGKPFTKRELIRTIKTALSI